MALDLNDKTANGNNLTNVGVAEVTNDSPFSPDTSVGTWSSAGTNYMTTVDSASNSFTSNCSLEAWVKTASLPADGATMVVINKGIATASDRCYELAVKSIGGTGATTQMRISSDGLSYTNATGTFVMVTGTWYHIAGLYAAAAGTVQLLINGTNEASVSSMPTSIRNGTSNFTLGATNAGAGAYFNGKIDEVRGWGTLRTQAQISANYGTELVGNEGGLNFYYPLNSIPSGGGAAAAFFGYKNLTGVGI